MCSTHVLQRFYTFKHHTCITCVAQLAMKLSWNMIICVSEIYAKLVMTPKHKRNICDNVKLILISAME